MNKKYYYIMVNFILCRAMTLGMAPYIK
jgi:hypothetical protein